MAADLHGGIHAYVLTGGIITLFFRYIIVPRQASHHRRERETMNGESKREMALGVVALGVGVAVGAVLGNDATRKHVIDKSKSWISEHRRK